ncbi:MAG: DUF4032 domain-containing protein [Arthrobacter sp.]|uniref:DUF4032 domain-containing protein n=1 Tax=Arthrobacter sp. 179 TaxID=3457734 RepID=UPI00265628E4|nr:DUF4032 domain-containing protein [Micrococcaceae bacterium]MDN5906117.1 DUF4032 domain-containing protein [Micrococcaceae bacterium]MDN6201307.1 DUF4032 domain-containing protein [Micrococcaceae bacterium]
MTRHYASWHNEPTDYSQHGKLPRETAISDETPRTSLGGSLNITSATMDSALLDLPWHIPLEDWPARNLAALPRGISRHVVRFALLRETVIAVKETGEHIARHEYHMLRKLNRLGVPCVEPVAVISGRADENGEELDPVLVTRHLKYSLPYRALFSQRLRRETLHRLIDAQALLLVRLHLAGFYWGDVSLSNTLFRRDAESFAAYLVDAETGELYPSLSDGQREYDLEIARVNIAGELMDLMEASLIEDSVDPLATSEQIMDSYHRLWQELTRRDHVDLAERWRVDERIRRLNDLGFDVDEIALRTTADGTQLQIQPKVVDAGHHQRRLLRLTGLDVQEFQARRLLNDIDAFRARKHPEMDEELNAAQWVHEVFDPITQAIPRELHGKLEPAQLVHEVLEHRWFISEQRGSNVPMSETIESYIETILRHRRDEAAIMLNPPSGVLDAVDQPEDGD